MNKQFLIDFLCYYFKHVKYQIRPISFSTFNANDKQILFCRRVGASQDSFIISEDSLILNTGYLIEFERDLTISEKKSILNLTQGPVGAVTFP